MEKSRVELADKIVESHAYLISGAFGCHGIGMPVFRIEKSHIRSLQDQEPVGFRDHETLPVRRVAALCQGIQDLLQVAEISIDGQPFELGNGLGTISTFQSGRSMAPTLSQRALKPPLAYDCGTAMSMLW